MIMILNLIAVCMFRVGIEQEYILWDKHGRPIGFPNGGYAAPQGPYYCSVGANNAIGRQVAEDHIKACLVCLQT